MSTSQVKKQNQATGKEKSQSTQPVSTAKNDS
jgi:hypothetical protein